MRRDREQLLEAMRFPTERFLDISGGEEEHFFGMWSMLMVLTSAGYDLMHEEPITEPDDWMLMTVLTHITMSTMHRQHGATVMEDSRSELSRHLPLLMVARGKVLVTGLGLGCVVRGLLSLDEVERVDVIEIDRLIIDTFWPEFENDPRAHIHHMDARNLQQGRGFDLFERVDRTSFTVAKMKWDFAWHDLWFEDDRKGSPKLNIEHGKLLHGLKNHVGLQGCWGMDRRITRLLPMPLLHARRRRPNLRRRYSRSWRKNERGTRTRSG